VAYILNLLVTLSKLNPEEAKKRQKEIIDMVAGEVQLRSKRELIEKFIEENLPKLQANESVVNAFEGYWSERKQTAFEQLCADEQINPEQLQKLLQNYEFASRFPRQQEIKDALGYQPRVLERKSILGRVAEKIQDFINTFIEGMGGSV
jgi:type I restriction enzyme R subunit